MDSTSIIRPAPAYGLLPSLVLLALIVVIYNIKKIIGRYKAWRWKNRQHLNQRGNGNKRLLTHEKALWLHWCKGIKNALRDFKLTNSVFHLYKAVALCVSCKSGYFLLSKSPLKKHWPLVSKDVQVALESLYVRLYSRHPLAKIYIEKLINIIKRLKCV